MEETFIREVEIHKVRNIRDFKIGLDPAKRTHLIITGKNGSGKTSLLNEIAKFISQEVSAVTRHQELLRQIAIAGNDSPRISHLRNELQKFGGISILFSYPEGVRTKFKSGRLVLSYFDTKRNAEMPEPQGFKKIPNRQTYTLQDSARNVFLQYMVNLKAEGAFANEEGDEVSAKKIDAWFESFRKSLSALIGNEVKLNFDRKKFTFHINELDKEPYTLNQLSDGYSAIISILAELIVRMEQYRSTSAYDVEGVVLIDEIETHLHIELQKQILPFLIAFFPKVQFIVSTHSPFVISSVDNAVICDLEKRVIIEDLSRYSYEAIVESYFDSDKYSNDLKEKLRRYEVLMQQSEMSESERTELKKLEHYFSSAPIVMSDELTVKLQQIRMSKLG